MKICGECGAENIDEAKFCVKCGSAIAESDDGVTCPNCGTQNTADSAFCVKCGTSLIEKPPTECPSCGATLVEGAKFCAMCGTAIEVGAKKTTAGVRAAGATSGRAAKKLGAAEAKVKAFEAKHAVIINALVIAFALVFILVSLLVPIKMSVALTDDIGSSVGSPSALSDVEVSTTEIKQPIWNFFSALGYIGLDMEDEDDRDKITEIIEEYAEASEEAQNEYKEWRKAHEYASTAKCKEQYIEIYGEKLSGVNMLAYTLAFSTTDVINTFLNEELSSSTAVDFEAELEDTLEYMYSTAAVAAVEGMIASIAAIAVAAVSAVFAAFAIYGMVCKRTRVNVFVMLTACLILCGVGLLLQAVSPALIMSGGLFASALTAACAYLVLGAAQALMNGGKIIVVAKRVAVAVIGIVAFFILSGKIFTVATTAKAGSEKISSDLSAPICLLFDRLMYAVLIKELSGYDVVYADASVASLVITLILCAVMLALIYTSLVFSLRAVRKPDKRATAWHIIACAALLLISAVVPAILGGVSKLSATVDEGEIEMMCKIKARAQVYVSMALSIVAFVLAKLFEPKRTSAPAAPQNI
ncbi:MAG: zinc ribbon domain-containing protein [Roseburia sp.]|nr:zinc ribbon domain-containing protein [Roseburia sp.]